MLLDEHVRFFMEECDSPQGFQLFADIQDGFSGLSASLLDMFRDDYPKKSIFTFGLGVADQTTFNVKLNEARALASLSESSSLYVPLYVPSKKHLQLSCFQYLQKKVRFF